MTDLDAIIEQARHAVERSDAHRVHLQRATLAALLAEVDRLHSWDGLMELLDEHWPEDIFPTLPDDDSRDQGPRIVSLLRWVDRLRAVAVVARVMARHFPSNSAVTVQLPAELCVDLAIALRALDGDAS